MPPTTYTLKFTRAFTIVLTPGDPDTDIDVPADCVWKIESAGIGGTKGVIYLKKGADMIAILFSSINNDDYGSLLPFWLDDSYTTGVASFSIENEAGFKGVLSITEYYLSIV